MKTLSNKFIKSYLQLLNEYSPSEISVKQIVVHTNASRSAFYIYFDSRETLHLTLKTMVENKFFSFYNKDNRVTDADSIRFTLCQHILKYRFYYKHAFKDTLEVEHLSNQLSYFLTDVYEDQDYAIFASYGTIGYLKKWVEDGFVISPAEASEKLMKIGFTNWSSKVMKQG